MSKAVFFPPAPQRPFIGVETPGAVWSQKCVDDEDDAADLIAQYLGEPRNGRSFSEMADAWAEAD